MSRNIAFVLGGSRGIGAEIVKELARDGSIVAFTYNESVGHAKDLEQTLAKKGRKAIALRADSRAPSEVERAVVEIGTRFGRIDTLVNNAGIFDRGEITNVSIAQFDELFSVNVRGPFVATRAAVQFMCEGSRVIMIGSVAADRSAMAGSTLYAATKAAVAAMARGMARDLAPLGITVNTIQPGLISTSMSSSSNGAELRALIPIGRKGSPNDVATLVRFLAGRDSSYITGSTINIDGGLQA